MRCGGVWRGWSDHPISSMSHAHAQPVRITSSPRSKGISHPHRAIQANNTLKMTMLNEYNAKTVKLCRAVLSLAGVLLRTQRAAQPKQRKTTATIKDATA